jgi:uncharacterized repeat protein (TIGR01451 family)
MRKKPMRHAFTGLLMLALVGVAASAWAQGRPNLVVEIRVEREIYGEDTQGRTKETRVEVQETSRDDVLVYTLHWKNQGDGVARGAVLSDPIPSGTALLRGSLEGAPAQVTYSVDGENYSEWPQTKSADVNGKETWTDVPESAVRHIRWRLAEAVPPGGSGEASFKVLVQ